MAAQRRVLQHQHAALGLLGGHHVPASATSGLTSLKRQIAGAQTVFGSLRDDVLQHHPERRHVELRNLVVVGRPGALSAVALPPILPCAAFSRRLHNRLGSFRRAVRGDMPLPLRESRNIPLRPSSSSIWPSQKQGQQRSAAELFPAWRGLGVVGAAVDRQHLAGHEVAVARTQIDQGAQQVLRECSRLMSGAATAPARECST